jgi:hypothetical protein
MSKLHFVVCILSRTTNDLFIIHIFFFTIHELFYAVRILGAAIWKGLGDGLEINLYQYKAFCICA